MTAETLKLAMEIGRGVALGIAPQATAPVNPVTPVIVNPRAERTKPVHISKLVTKFDGTCDHVSHLEMFGQICEAFGQVDDPTKVSAFGLTLEGKARQWFRSLKAEDKATFEALKQAFTVGYLRQGTRWSIVDQLYNVK
ncbi:hypothetical protein HX035_24270 [Escherichia coli]|nr:hypothetical protein [Escherichia coli]